jgi:thioredoxin reductase
MKSKRIEYLIIGAGPAGIQLGYFLEKANRNYLILESAETPVGFFQKYPRQRKLISINKVYTGYDDQEINLRWDWNSLLNDSEEMLFKNYSKRYFPGADILVEYLHDFVKHFNLKIKCGTRIVKISKDESFKLIDSDGNFYECDRLIISTGVSKPYIPSIPGIELAENYTNVSINPDDFVNQKVLVIGKGNSGFEIANNLTETAAMIHVTSPNPIKMAWQTHFVGHLRAINNNLLDTYQLKSQNAILDATIEQIQHRDDKFVVSFNYTHANDEREDLIYDRVILCTGFRFDDSIFDDSCRPEMVRENRLPNQTSEWESTNIKDLYFAGTLMQVRDYKKSSSSFIHGFRYNIRTLHRIFEYKYHGQQWQYQQINATPQAIVDAIVQRINTTSALWQQFGFLCDLITISEDGQIVKYYQELPMNYVHENELGQCSHYYTITLEFGLDILKNSPDLFAMERVHKDNADSGSQSAFLHPIIRHFSQGQLIAEHHVIEDLASEWLEDVHITPLLKFFVAQLVQADIVNNADYSQSDIKLLDIWQQSNQEKAFSEEILVTKD